MRRAFIAAFIVLLVFSLLNTAPVKASWPKNFLEDEAGITAYFQFEGPTNLKSNLLRNLFQSVSISQDDYLVGFVPTPGFEGYRDLDVKVFVHTSGWVAAYIPADKLPSAMVFNSDVSTVTRLDLILEKIAAAIEVTSYEPHYFNFRYPQATGLLLIQAKAPGSAKEIEIDFRLPGQNKYYERSWYIVSNGLFTGTVFTLDGKQRAAVYNGLSCAPIDEDELVPNAKHIIKLQGGMLGGYFGMAILFSGSEPYMVNYADSVDTITFDPIPQGLEAAALDVPFFLDLFLPMITR